jgi:hypothetical protein
MAVGYYTNLQLTISPVETIRPLTGKNAVTRIRQEKKIQELPVKKGKMPP